MMMTKKNKNWSKSQNEEKQIGIELYKRKASMSSTMELAEADHVGTSPIKLVVGATVTSITILNYLIDKVDDRGPYIIMNL